VTHHLIPYFGKKPLRSIERADIQAWARWAEDHDRSDTVVNKAYRVLHAILNEATVSEKIDRNPARKIYLPRVAKKEPRPLTPEELIRLVGEITPRFATVTLLAGVCGLR
jgi:integrase